MERKNAIKYEKLVIVLRDKGSRWTLWTEQFSLHILNSMSILNYLFVSYQLRLHSLLQLFESSI